jgi:formylglycine-generating enzyme required for sulfatase activity
MGGDHLMPDPTESPAHPVKLARFLIATTEVTFADYDRFARDTGAVLPDDRGWGRGQRPVIGVNWNDAVAYTRWLSSQTGERYRLPTEAEWEYAARAGTTTFYWWGNDKGAGNAVCFDCGSRWDNQRTAPVASLSPNPFGLYDTSGNVAEWVADCWFPDHSGAPGDGSARTATACPSRVARGGAFNKPATSMRDSTRQHFDPFTRIDMLGFRVARDI